MNAVGQNLNATHYQSNLMSWVISNAVLEAAFAEVVKSREHDSHNTNIWWLRRNWPAQKQALRDSLLNSIDRLSLLKRKSLDQTAPPDCATARYMDDGIIFVKTRWQLWRVIKNMHEVVHGLKLKLDLDKTFIDRVHKGFDFLGYRFNASGLCGLVQKTIDNHWNKRLRLHEHTRLTSVCKRISKHGSAGCWRGFLRLRLAGCDLTYPRPAAPPPTTL